ncbi:uncharacterized protein TrAtP1_009769 [Trichoderma atroviride]|uniref:uncharacterized protein n=1 Tax=Hypocrea atroviridis TaxID=63577 RepID=UPI003316BED1|nr:hypothetical protein TrAtP1_009769 [Trichoderma atroviride]
MIEAFPSQIYISALVFSPMKSRLRKTFEAAESPTWMPIKPIMRQEWGACLQTIESHERRIHFVTFSPDNSKLASIIRNEIIEVWDLATGALVQDLQGRKFATSAAFSSNGNMLALLCLDGVEIWDLVGGSLLKKIYQIGIKSVAFATEDTHLSILGFNSFKIHDIAKNVDLHTYLGQSGDQFHDVLFSPGYVQLALGAINGSVGTWDPANWMLVPYFTNQTFGARLVVTCKQETSTLLKVVDLAAGEYTQAMLKHRVNLNALLFYLTSDGMRLVARHYCKITRVWDLTTGLWQTLDFPDKASDETLKQAAFSPCLMRLALANDEDIYVWDVASGKYRWASTGHASSTTALAVSPDGSRLALAAHSGTIKVLEMAARAPLQSPESRPDAIVEMAFSPSGKWLASLSYNGTKLWDPATGECLRTWRASSNLTALAISLDSVWLALHRLQRQE